MVIAPPQERPVILLGIVGDCGDEERLERGNCEDKGPENKWRKKNSFSLSALGRSKVQACDIRACYSILCTTHTWDLNLFLDIQ